MASIDAQLVVVVPTYNELENIDTLVERVEAVRASTPARRALRGRRVARRHRRSDPRAARVAAVDPHPRTRGTPGARLRVPRRVPLGAGERLRAHRRDGCRPQPRPRVPGGARCRGARRARELALGSRYTRGGGSEGWPLHRRILSRGANLFARTLLRLPTKDVTGGFRVYDRAAIDLLLEQGTECDGYGFQVEGVYARDAERVCASRRSRSSFRDRAYGRSKMSRSIVWEATRRCVAFAFETTPCPGGIGTESSGGGDRWPLTHRHHAFRATQRWALPRLPRRRRDRARREPARLLVR